MVIVKRIIALFIVIGALLVVGGCQKEIREVRHDSPVVQSTIPA